MKPFFCFVFALVLMFSACTSMDETAPLPTEESIEITLPVQGNVADRDCKVFYGTDGGATYTGLTALPEREYAVADPQNTAGYSEEAVDHYYGTSENGEVHRYSREFQQRFDSEGLSAVVYDTRTDEKRIYLTFDCGYENGNTGLILDVLKEKQVPAAFFCTLYEVKTNPDLIARMVNEGHIVGNHSVTHADFTTLTRTEMAEELMGFDNYMRENFGYSSLYFRFPEGRYNDNAIQLVQTLGFTSVFWSAAYNDWDTTKQKGADYALTQVTKQLHPGMILLLHSVSADNAAALGSIIDTARANGYTFCALTQL